MSRVYVASSWRNRYQPEAVTALREAGFDPYDFREPAPGKRGFNWREIDPAWESWSTAQYIEALEHPIAAHGFAADFGAMAMASACLLVMPCGRSAHVEAGYILGGGKPVVVWIPERAEPELMYAMFHGITESLPRAIELLRLYSDRARGGVHA